MNPETSQIPRRPAWSPEDSDAQGRYLYPGDVEDAMPEGTWARLLANYLVETILRVVGALDRGSAHANLPIYYRKGDPKKHVSPDAFFLAGVPYDPHLKSYCLWETGVIPPVVFEILSPGSQWKDRVANRRIYEELGIPEYYWFDPEACRLEALILDPATRRYRERIADPSGRYRSEALGLEVGVVADAIALYRDGTYLPPTAELLREAERRLAESERGLAEEANLRQESERGLAEEAERRLASERRLTEEANLRQESERRLTEEAKRRLAESERGLAEERQLRAEADARIRELEQRLRDAGQAP